MEPGSHRRASLGSVTLHYVEAGNGPPVIFLHGFPEFWYSWRHQIVAVAEAGFRAIAPDLRGYNESDKPPRVADYRLEVLVDDIARLIGAVGGGAAIIVGHDWGGVIAWELAMRRPELVARLVISTRASRGLHARATHPGNSCARGTCSFSSSLAARMANRRQGLRFAPPYVPAVLPRPRILIVTRRRSRGPGAITAMVNYYAPPCISDRTATYRTIQATLLIWGEATHFSACISPRVDERGRGCRWSSCATSAIGYQNETAERVNALLVEFLKDR